MDDYLIISTDSGVMKRFLQRLHTSLRVFGGGVNPEKTRVSYPVQIEIDACRISLRVVSEREREREITWCGWKINTKTLEVSPDLSRLVSLPLKHSILVDNMNGNLGLIRAVHSFIRSKSHSIVLDGHINRSTVVARSVHKIFLIAAMRTLCYIKQMRKKATTIKHIHQDHCLAQILLKAIKWGVGVVYSRSQRYKRAVKRVREKEVNKEFEPSLEIIEREVKRDYDDYYPLSFTHFQWLGMHAYITALSHRRGLYYPVLQLLSRHLKKYEKTLKKYSNTNFKRNMSIQDLIECCDTGDILSTTQWL